MADDFNRLKHTVLMQNRETLELGGIKDVDAFNEEEITASSDWGDITVKGENLHVEVLELETGILKISGKIGALLYSENAPVKGFFRRLMS